MSLTDEERTSLELECANAKVRCKEAWQVLLTLEKITKTYFRIHDLWRKRFEKADRRLAEEDRLIKIKGGDKKKKQELSKEQLMEILAELEKEGGE